MHQLIDQRVDQRVQRKDFSRLHLDVSQEKFFDLPFDHVHWCTLDVKENRDTCYICNMGRSDLPDMYARARGRTYQANHNRTCYICYVTLPGH